MDTQLGKNAEHGKLVEAVSGRLVRRTFLFTDIEGWTSLSERLGDRAYQEILPAHHALLRKQFRKYGSEKETRSGDGFVMPFSEAREAVECAVACQKALAAHPWPEEVGSLRVRMALYTGDVYRREAGYDGLALNRASRVLEAAHGGQILCSELTAALLGGNLPGGIWLVDLGIYRLRGVERPEKLFQVNYPEMVAREFPPLRAEVEYAGNVPTQETRFFGREEELARLSELARDPKRRLVTLTGLGGSGKTRLAVEAAQRLRQETQRPLWFVRLEEVKEASGIAQAIVEALHLRPSPQLDPRDQAVATLAEQPCLLVLGNFEHLLDESDEAVAVVCRLLERARGLKLIVTSRERLNIGGEVQLAAGLLPVPEDDESVEELARCASVALFVDRAQAVRADFQLTSENSAAVAELCRRLEGHPLSLELAAAQADVLTPAEMVKQVCHSIDFLRSRERDRPERHRSLQAVINWTYKGLRPELQRLFCGLSVFRGGWTLEAAEVVCEDPKALEHLQELCDKSMVRATAASTAAQTRYEFAHGLLRDFGRTELPKDEHVALCDRHADYFQSSLKRLCQQGLAPAAEWVRRELSNIFAALDWLLQANFERAVELFLDADAAWLFDTPRGINEGRQYIDRMLEQAGSRLAPARRVDLLLQAASYAWIQADYARVREHAEEAVQASRALKSDRHLVRALRALARAHRDEGRLADAWTVADEALRIARCRGNAQEIAAIRAFMGTLARYKADYPSAVSLLEESMETARDADRAEDRSAWLCELGIIAYEQGKLEEARTRLEESLQAVRADGILADTSWAAANLAVVGLCEGEVATARETLHTVLEAHRERGDLRAVAFASWALGCAARLEGDPREACQLLEEAVKTQQKSRCVWGLATYMATLAWAKLGLGEVREAERRSREGLEHAANLGERKAVAECLEAFAAVCTRQNEPMVGVRLFAAADALREATGAAILPWDKKDRDCYVAEARHALGEDAFGAAWAEGRRLSWEDAVREALAVP